MSELEELKQINQKLDQLLILIKISNLDKISKTKEELQSDPIFSAILSLADGSLTSKQLKEKVAKKVKKGVRTVESRLADLVEKGVLKVNKKGREYYYEQSGLFD